MAEIIQLKPAHNMPNQLKPAHNMPNTETKLCDAGPGHPLYSTPEYVKKSEEVERLRR